jgi:3-deoxy-manno-octulosonate cytidylyltransferase (CMP-KDO synthetase)
MLVAVPAHLGSRRVPRKVLADIGGWPMLRHVLERCRAAQGALAVVLCTDAPELAAHARSWGFAVQLQQQRCDSGTERIARALPALLTRHAADVPLEQLLVVNVQADQPFLDPGLITRLQQAFGQQPADTAVVTPVYQLGREQIHEPDVVKVLATADLRRAITFSRSALPHVQGVAADDWHRHATYWGHVGVYGYRASVLQRWMQLPVSPLERLESLEQLRLVDAGLPIALVTEHQAVLSVDTPAQLEQARRLHAASQR